MMRSQSSNIYNIV